MKKIIDFCNECKIDNSLEKWGDNYFNDNFNVSGLLVSFDAWLDREAYNKQMAFLSYMKKQRRYDVCLIRSHGITSYRILSVFDAKRLEKHNSEKQAAVVAFWKAEHARRQLKNIKLA